MIKPKIKDNIKYKSINCPQCNSSRVIKNGRSCGKQRYKCKDCDRHFQEAGNLNNQSCKAKQEFINTKNNQLPKKVLILLTKLFVILTVYLDPLKGKREKGKGKIQNPI